MNGTKVINPMQQASATKLYNKAYRLKGEMEVNEFIKIHRQVIDELKSKDN